MRRHVAHAAIAAAALLVAPAPSRAQGHGPIFGLSTPTLGRGGWSLDVTGMSRLVGGTGTAMLRPMLSYGVSEDVQLSASVPMPLYARRGIPPARASTRMPASADAELMLGWRFQRHAPGVGVRVELTAYLGFDYPTDAVRAGVPTAPGVVGGVVTGYASRTVYAWAGALYRRYTDALGAGRSHLGDVAMYSLVLGYRPPPFQRDYPHPDWRLFIEAVGESAARDVAGGVPRGQRRPQIFVGPTVSGCTRRGSRAGRSSRCTGG